MHLIVSVCKLLHALYVVAAPSYQDAWGAQEAHQPYTPSAPPSADYSPFAPEHQHSAGLSTAMSLGQGVPLSLPVVFVNNCSKAEALCKYT